MDTPLPDWRATYLYMARSVIPLSLEQVGARLLEATDHAMPLDAPSPVDLFHRIAEMADDAELRHWIADRATLSELTVLLDAHLLVASMVRECVKPQTEVANVLASRFWDCPCAKTAILLALSLSTDSSRGLADDTPPPPAS